MQRSNVKVGRGCRPRPVVAARPAANVTASAPAAPKPDYRLATAAQTATYRAQLIALGRITPVAA